MNKELELYDPAAWVGKWPHEKKTIWDVHSKVHARFGLAVQACTKIETGLVMLVAQIKQLREYFEREQSTLEFKSLLTELSKAGALTMGRLIWLFRQLYGVPKDHPVIRELERAKKSRNYLIHHFYRHRGDHFESPEGCERLIEELVSIYDDFHTALEHLEEWHNRSFGYTSLDDILDEINEDVEKWRFEQEQMLKAILGKKGRKR